MDIYKKVEKVRMREPLVQCITNFVTVNDCANILLATGASPTMAMDIREVEESVTRVQALVCNMGAIEHVESMICAGKKANELGIPVVLDPVGAGGTALRRDASKKLLEEVHFTAIRGNASEIKALAGHKSIGSGVDVSKEDKVSENTLDDTVRIVENFAREIKSVVAVSGEIDIVTDGTQTVLIRNGCPTMARITGSGCMVTTLIGGFCGAENEDRFQATCAAMIVMGIAGELADEKRIQNKTGNATFRNDLIDAIFNMSEQEIKEKVNYELYKRSHS